MGVELWKGEGEGETREWTIYILLRSSPQT